MIEEPQEEQAKPAVCPKCDGKRYLLVENWHESEVWPCPLCNKDAVEGVDYYK